ncbi:MAG: hypothetical protein HY906_22570 [Deltaproteobacteria bacterium]|nr:hypothetical protein [Deltaproteobacteria bacterium]
MRPLRPGPPATVTTPRAPRPRGSGPRHRRGNAGFWFPTTFEVSFTY